MKRIAALLGVLALTTAAWATLAQAESGFKATGGGQFLVPEEGGAGSTIAFTAQNVEDETNEYAAKGQVQYVDRSADGKPLVYHGTVTCLAAVTLNDDYDESPENEGSQGAGVISGEWRKSASEDATAFTLYVQDNGEPNQGNDLIVLDEFAAEPECSDEEPDSEDKQPLGRGNVQIHNYTVPE